MKSVSLVCNLFKRFPIEFKQHQQQQQTQVSKTLCTGVTYIEKLEPYLKPILTSRQLRNK
ncbi:uncharacterized protein Dvir_GJ25579 [Drosophila virilis]|uniref:Uncharacterized protein n=1 Tax=Drosophila virilis TaxID=7244 RepID=A0A0Q9W9G0_DROVI|nr:uncharacterized protein Dvir_GJ25579 [Drosophila virilis]